jgi:hypothetical protein
MKFNVRIESCDCFGRADPSNKFLAFEEFERAIDGRLRHAGEMSLQPPVDRFGSRVGQIFNQGAIDGQPLRRNSYAPIPAKHLELGAPAPDFRILPVTGDCAINSHLRIIIIWEEIWQAIFGGGILEDFVDLYGRASVPAPDSFLLQRCTLDSSGPGTEARPYRMVSIFR